MAEGSFTADGLIDKTRAAIQSYRQRGNNVPTVVGDEYG